MPLSDATTSGKGGGGGWGGGVGVGGGGGAQAIKHQSSSEATRKY